MYTVETVVKIILVKSTVLLVWPQEEVMLHALFDITNLWNRILLDKLVVTPPSITVFKIPPLWKAVSILTLRSGHWVLQLVSGTPLYVFIDPTSKHGRYTQAVTLASRIPSYPVFRYKFALLRICQKRKQTIVDFSTHPKAQY
jgi:hypothetical protein